MVKKHLPVTKLVAGQSEQSARAVQPLFIGLASGARRWGRRVASCTASLTRPSLAVPADGRYKPPHPATSHMW
jgi:hypothetical protein